MEFGLCDEQVGTNCHHSDLTQMTLKMFQERNSDFSLFSEQFKIILYLGLKTSLWQLRQQTKGNDHNTHNFCAENAEFIRKQTV